MRRALLALTLSIALTLVVTLLTMPATAGSATAPINVQQPLLLSTVPNEENPIATNGEICWSAPRMADPAPGYNPRPEVPVRWPITQTTTFEWLWRKSQLDLADISGEGVAIWGYNAALTVTYRDGSICQGESLLVGNGNIYKVVVEPTGGEAAIWQGEIRGTLPECTYTAPQTGTVAVLESQSPLPVTTTLKIASEVCWQGVLTGTGMFTIPIGTQSHEWSWVEVPEGEVEGYLWEMNPELPSRIFLPLVVSE